MAATGIDLPSSHSIAQPTTTSRLCQANNGMRFVLDHLRFLITSNGSGRSGLAISGILIALPIATLVQTNIFLPTLPAIVGVMGRGKNQPIIAMLALLMQACR